MRNFLFTTCTAVLLSACVTTNEDKGITTRWKKEVAFNIENFAYTQTEIEAGANRGEASYQFLLGRLYEQGQGVEQDYIKAEYWYLKAAKKGYIYAQDSLGWIYEYQYDLFEKLNKSAYWYRLAAEQGYASAQNSLGFFYAHGTAVKLNYKTAYSWFLKASKQGFAPAQRNIGNLYKEGLGVKRDFNAAAGWYLKAAKNGDGMAANYLGEFYRDGLGVEQNQQIAIEWFKKASERNSYSGKQNLISLNALSFEQNHALAVNGNSQAQYELCHMYFNGEEVEVNYKRAVKWCTKSAIQGQVLAQESLARMFYGGTVIEQNYQSAYIWAMIARAQNAELEPLLAAFRAELTKQEQIEAKRKYSSCLPPSSIYLDCPQPQILDH